MFECSNNAQEFGIKFMRDKEANFHILKFAVNNRPPYKAPGEKYSVCGLSFPTASF